MPDERPLAPASPAELQRTLAHALQFDGRRHHHRADGFAAEWLAEHLAKCLAQSGFVVMKKPLPNDAKSVAWGPPRNEHLTE
jgi:hypothetical protein